MSEHEETQVVEEEKNEAVEEEVKEAAEKEKLEKEKLELEKLEMLTKDQILNFDDITFRDVPVPEWNGKVRLRSLSGVERDVFENAIERKRKADKKIDLKELKVTLLSLTIVDMNNALLFTPKDLEAFNKKSGKVIDDLFGVAQEMCGIGEDEVEELRKNS